MDSIIEDWYPQEGSPKESEQGQVPQIFTISSDFELNEGTTEQLSTHLLQIENCSVTLSCLAITQDIIIKENAHLTINECVFMPKFRTHTAAIDIIDSSELTVKNSHFFNQEGICLRLGLQSRCNLQSVLFGGSGHIIGMVTSNSLATFNQCFFHETKHGLVVQDSGECHISNCEFSQTSEFPITVLHGGFCLISDSSFSNCLCGAISIIESAAAEIERCIFSKIEGNVITLRKNSSVTLSHSEISDVNGNAILEKGQCKARIEGCKIRSSNYPALAIIDSQIRIEGTEMTELTGKGIVCNHKSKLEMAKSSVKALTTGILASDEAIVSITDSSISGMEIGISSQNGSDVILRKTKISSARIGIVGLAEGKVTADECDLQDCGELSIYLHHGANGFFSQNLMKPEMKIEESDVDAFLGNQSPTGKIVDKPKVLQSPPKSPQVLKGYSSILMPCGHAWNGEQPERCPTCGAIVSNMIALKGNKDKCSICHSSPSNCVVIPCGHCGLCSSCASKVHEGCDYCPFCREKATEFRTIRWQGGSYLEQ